MFVPDASTIFILMFATLLFICWIVILWVCLVITREFVPNELDDDELAI
jgi:hypothetical protein